LARLTGEVVDDTWYSRLALISCLDGTHGFSIPMSRLYHIPRTVSVSQILPDEVEHYASRMSDKDAAIAIGISYVSFWKLRNKYNIKSFFERTGLRKDKSTGKLFRFYQYNERYFSSIDSTDKAYFLGLLASDGNISPRLTACRIALKHSDADILDHFRLCLGADSPPLKTKVSKINGVENEPQKVLVLSRTSMVNDLIELGIVPNKSKTLEIKCPSLKDNELCTAFLRGVWDGDGSITHRRFKVVTASVKFACQLDQMIHQVTGIHLKPSVQRPKSGNPLFEFSGYVKDAAVLHALYKDPSPALKRKKLQYELHWESRR
jgi:hypothetical protein